VGYGALRPTIVSAEPITTIFHPGVVLENSSVGLCKTTQRHTPGDHIPEYYILKKTLFHGVRYVRIFTCVCVKPICRDTHTFMCVCVKLICRDTHLRSQSNGRNDSFKHHKNNIHVRSSKCCVDHHPKKLVRSRALIPGQYD
jgi:hypothetical protein